MDLFDSNYLFASLVWGSIGIGYYVYGKRQESWVPKLGGILMITTSYFAGSVWVMSLICVALMAVVYFLLKRDF